MQTIQEINTAIMHSADLTNRDLDQIIESVKWRRAQLARMVARTLRVGDQVKFLSNRTGKLVIGQLEGIKIKNAIVNTSMGRYRVPMNMLEAA